MSSKVEQASWTIAFRKPRANRFRRLTSWSGTWAQAVAVARLFSELHPELQVYYVSSAEAERAGLVHAEDVENILVDSGRRVRVVDVDDELPTELLVRIPAGEVANARWQAGEPIADPALTEDEAHAEALAICASIPVDGRPADVTALLVEAELVTDARENLVLVRRARDLLATDPLRAYPQAPSACLHAGCHPGRCVYGYAIA